MEFTLKSIQEAHEKYTGPDFPMLFKAFKDMGMVSNEVNIQHGTLFIQIPMIKRLQQKA